MTCSEAAGLLDARLDDELDMASSASIDLHLSGCPACAARYEALRNLHQEIAAADLAYAPGPALERKLAARFAESGKLKLVRWMRLSALAAAAVVAVVLMVAIPAVRNASETNAIAAEILDNHLRALLPMHPVDVPSSDQHTVKPWFQGKTGFSPPVPDLSAKGFLLAGGRLEVIGRQPAAAIVYRRREHVISLYVSPSTGADTGTRLLDLDGYHLLHWTRDSLSYWAVSDVATNDLRAFAAALQSSRR